MNSMIPKLLLFACLSLCGCQDNPAADQEPEASGQKDKRSIAMPVSAPELCGDFGTNVGMAITKYKDSKLTLSGKVAQTEVLPVDNNCHHIIMMCQTPDGRDTGSVTILIKRCMRDEVKADTIVPGKYISIPCRFIEYSDHVVRLEEISA